jgi:hypothetical protein
VELANHSISRMDSPPAQVSVVAPIQPAIERARRLLFESFDLARWFAIGFCAWLARLGEVGFSGFNFRVPLASDAQAPRVPSWHGSFAAWEQVRSALMRNLHWVLPLVVALAGLVVILWLVVVWLGSRGAFMFLHCVALDRAEVAVPWRRYAREARSLFFFRLALSLIAAVPILVLLATVVVVVVRIFRQGGTLLAGWLVLIAAGLALLALGAGFVVVAKLTQDFVVPIMFLRGATWRQAWRELLGLFAGRLHLLVVYLLFQIVLAMAIGVVIVFAVIATCCIAGCLMALPYLGTVALLPILVFQRAYSLYYLGQLGTRYDLFQTAAQPPVTPT